MMRRTRVIFPVCLMALGILVGSCKKDETTAPMQNAPVLTVGQTSFSLHPGDSSSTTISGGTLPYAVTGIGDTSVVRATISDAVLTIHARSAGSTTITVADHSSPSLSATISISVVALPLVATPPSVTLVGTAPQDVAISTGTHPYAIAQFPNSALATAQFVNANLDTAILTITGVSTATGSTSVTVRDASTPPRTVVVNIAKVQ